MLRKNSYQAKFRKFFHVVAKLCDFKRPLLLAYDSAQLDIFKGPPPRVTYNRNYTNCDSFYCFFVEKVTIV